MHESGRAFNDSFSCRLHPILNVFAHVFDANSTYGVFAERIDDSDMPELKPFLITFRHVALRF